MDKSVYIDEEKANNAHMVQFIDEIMKKKESSPSTDRPREVEIYFYLWRIHDIDTVKQSFTITITTSFTWIEDNAKDNFAVNKAGGNWRRDNFKWNPQIRFTNVIEEDDLVKEEWFRVTPAKMSRKNINSKTNISKEQWMDQYRDSNELMSVTQFMRKKITISEAFELKNFPFDLQPLHVQLTSSWDCENVLLTFNKSMPSSFDPNPLDSQEWDFHMPRLISYDMDWRITDQPLLSLSSQSISGARYSRAYIALTVKRKPQYYMWNMYVMLLILGTLSFTVFSVDVEETGDRLGIMLTLVLALVAFKLVLVQSLPSISYLTMLDVYTLGSILLMFFISIFNALIPSLGIQRETMMTLDFIILMIGAVLWTQINIWFLTKTLMLSRKRKEEVNEINRSFLAYRSAALHKPIYRGYKSFSK